MTEFSMFCSFPVFIKMHNILIHDAKIWRSGLKKSSDKSQFYNWMIFDKLSGKIESCGKQDDNLPYLRSKVKEEIDCNGKWILPGFHDAHIHISWHGAYLTDHTFLKVPTSIKQMQERLKVMLSDPYNDPTEGNPWFVAYGFEQHVMERYPTAQDLDVIENQRPLLVYHSSFHIAVLNTIGLKMADIDENTEIKGGGVDLYPNDQPLAGKPTGILREAAIDLVMDFKIPRSSSKIKQAILSALNECVKLGITSVHCLDKDVWNEYVELAKEEKLPIQCFFATFYTDMDTNNKPTKAGETHGSNLSCRCVKIFADGALGSDTAALSLPYPQKDDNGKDNYGVLYYSQDDLDKMVKEIDSLGYQLEIHAIGDKAAESAIIAMERANILPDKRPIIVHAQLLNHDLIKRMAKLGVIASLQPTNVPADARYSREKISPPLQKCMYPCRSLIDNGVKCAGSSDSPCLFPNTLLGIYDAIFQPDCVKGQGSFQLKEQVRGQRSFQQGEEVTFSQAVDMYTSDAAYVDFAENFIGRLEPGYYANFVLLETPVVNGEIVDLSKYPERLLNTQVVQTWVRGVRLY
ncbi:putative amidohydrolase YtcJ [Styela clava]